MAKFCDLPQLEIISDRNPCECAELDCKDKKPLIWINKRTGRKFKQVITWVEIGVDHAN